MQSVSTGIKRAMKDFLVEGNECPHCHKPMVSWQEKEGQPHRMGYICMACGYGESKKKELSSSISIEEDSRKIIAYGYLEKNSIIKDRSLLKCRFESFERVNDEQKNAVIQCKELADSMANRKIVRLGIVGRVGVGKSHLAMSTLHEVIEKSNYKARCLFIDFAALLNEFKFAMNDKEASKALEKVLLKEIEKSLVVVIDDIGADVGDGRGNATPYTVERLIELLNSRNGKSLIYTTNLSSKDIRALYGERTASRLLNKENAYFVTFKETCDYRLKSS